MSAALPPGPVPPIALAAIETPRLRLEPLLELHARELFAGLTAPALYVFMDDAPPTSEAALAERYRFLEARRSPDGSELWLNWALFGRESQAYVGTVQATVRPGGDAEIAYLLLPPAQGLGFASEAVTAMLAALRNSFGARAFIAHVDPRNRASLALLDRLGFTRAGTRAASSPAQPEPDLVFRLSP